MKKILDKLTHTIKLNKKMIVFLIGIVIVGIISGSIFTIILDSSDKNLISDYFNNYVTSLNGNKLDYLDALKNGLISNIGFVLIVWLLGISVIGIPITLFMFFSKSFIVGFTISSFMIYFKTKGAFLAMIYLFPHQIINILAFTILMMFSISLSIKLIQSFVKKQAIDFKHIMNKYVIILVACTVIIVLTTLYEIFIAPIILNNFV